MKVSTKTRYAARALAEMAAAGRDSTLSLGDMAERQQLSAKYLEQIFAALKAAGVVESVRGAGGGYRLARPAQDITLGEVFRALEGPPIPSGCEDGPDSCSLADACPTRETWIELRQAVEEVLEGTTVRQLGERLIEKGGRDAMTYHI